MNIYTNPQDHTDGFGAQYQRIIISYIVTTHNSNVFNYIPLSFVEHNYDNSPLFLTRLEMVMNIRDNIPILDKKSRNYTVYNTGNIIKKFEENIDEYCSSKSMKFIKECFWKNKTKKLVFNNDKINIAVHIRRGNIHDRGQAGERITTPNEYYLNIMNEIRNKYKDHDKELLFHIYSQGDMNNFAILQKEDVIFHLDEDICKTFTELVAADILLTSPSSLSYVAALISDGEIYFKQFWHKPRSTWIITS